MTAPGPDARIGECSNPAGEWPPRCAATGFEPIDADPPRDPRRGFLAGIDQIMDDERVWLLRLKVAEARSVGARQTLRALHKGTARVVYVARDADPEVTGPIIGAKRPSGVELVMVESMEELGRACGIEVGASAAAILAPDRGPERREPVPGGPERQTRGGS